MVREYLKAKGIVPSPPGKTPTGKEYMAIMDLGLMKSPMFAPKPDEYYMDKWWNTTRSDGSARPMFPQASPVAPAAPAMPPAPVAPVAPPAQPPAQQPRPLPPPKAQTRRRYALTWSGRLSVIAYRARLSLVPWTSTPT
jgi:hypothetical protein